MTPRTPSIIELDEPADRFVDAFLLGNGWLGATVHGRPEVEQIDLNVDTLWSGGPGPVPTAPATDVSELRSAIRDGDLSASEALALGRQSTGWAQSYLPLARLSWAWNKGGTATAPDYIRRLDPAAAESTTRAGNAECAVFVSAPDGVLVGLAPLDAGSGEISLTSPLRMSSLEQFDRDGIQWIVATGRAPIDVVPLFITHDDPISYADDEPDAEGLVNAGMGWAVVVATDIDPVASERRIVVSAETGFRGWDQRPSADLASIAELARTRVTAALASTTAELRRRHLCDYRELFDRVSLDLGDSHSEPAARAQCYFDLGRHLLIASSRAGTQASNLQGIWNTDLRAPWSSGYTTNINLEMNYWAAEVLQLPEVHEPLFNLVAELAEAGKGTARAYYNSDGTAAHHNTDLWRFSEPVAGRTQWSNWQSSLAWLAAHPGERLDRSWSDDFAERALSMLRPIARFVLDSLEAASDGRLVTTPSTSPEHEFTSDGLVAAVTFGSSMDQELAAEVLARLISVTERLGEDDDELVREARSALPRLRMPTAGKGGRLVEWAKDYDSAEPGHRHVSHLYGLFPGSRIGPHTPVEFEAARASLAHRLENGGGYTGWSQAWILCLAGRLRDPALAETSLEILLGPLSSESLLDMHPFPWDERGTVFQIDGNLGALRGMTELVMQSQHGVISLLPALPESWPVGRAVGFRAHDGAVVSVSWRDHRLTSADILVPSPRPVRVELARGARHTVTGPDGARLMAELHDHPYLAERVELHWTAPQGGTYLIEGEPAGQMADYCGH